MEKLLLIFLGNNKNLFYKIAGNLKKQLKIFKMKTININGKDFTLEELSNLVESAKKGNPMDKVFRFHSITEEQFNKDYENTSEFAKAIEIEAMIVNYYNISEKVDFNNSKQSKWYLWFYLGDNFRLRGCDYYDSISYVPSRLCFLRKEDALEASKVYFEQYRNSRNN